MRQTFKNNLCTGFDYDHTRHKFCEICPLGNSKVPSLNQARTRATQPCELVHVDLWGPSPVRSLTGNKYLIVFTDDFSRYSAIYALSKKSAAVNALRRYIDEQASPLGTHIRTIQSDGGGEFLGSFADFCKLQKPAIQIQMSAPDMQQQNGVAERVWGTIISATIRMLQDAKLPATYFQDAAHTAVFIRNRLAHAALDKISPYEAFHGKKPNLSLLRVFGSPAYVHEHHRKKLDAKARPCVFVGYSTNHRAWRFYDPARKTYCVSRAATFNERIDDNTPTLTLLKHTQPTDLQISILADGLSDNDAASPDATEVTDSVTDKISATGSTASTPPVDTTSPRGSHDTASSATLRSASECTDIKVRPPGVSKALTDASGEGGEVHEPRAPETSDRVLRHRQEAEAAPPAAGTAEEILKGARKRAMPPTSHTQGYETKFAPTPHKNMTVLNIAQYFGVNPSAYMDWITSFSPFRKGEKLHIKKNLRRKPTRVKKGTDVPVPTGDPTFDEVVKSLAHRSEQAHLTTFENEAMWHVAMLTTATIGIITPKNWKQARGSPQREHWHRAMETEYQALVDNGTWTLVPRPKGKNVISSTWTFKIKENPDGTIEKYKARLCCGACSRPLRLTYLTHTVPVCALRRTVLRVS